MKKYYPYIRDYFLILLAALIQAFSLRTFFIPANLASGGVSGISQLINYFTGFPIGLLILIGNIPLFILGWRFLGGYRFAMRTAAAILTYSIFIDLLPKTPLFAEGGAGAALIRDLQQRGLWDDTLIVWGGEFGRTPMVEASAALGRSQGRDHHPYAFTIWFAGGGIRGGASVGATDDLGLSIIDRPVHVHDVQATILHLLGIDHERLSVPFQGLNVRLTGVEPHAPIREIVA